MRFFCSPFRPRKAKTNVSLLLLSFLAATAAACGSAIPRPVPPPNDETLTEAPPSESTQGSGEGVCGHDAVRPVARFIRHYNARDGVHYHAWSDSDGVVAWFAC
jgi:hypothetical protein